MRISCLILPLTTLMVLVALVPAQAGEPWFQRSAGNELNQLRAVATNGTGFVAVGDDGLVMVSDDGRTWRNDQPTNRSLKDIVWDGTQLCHRWGGVRRWHHVGTERGGPVHSLRAGMDRRPVRGGRSPRSHHHLGPNVQLAACGRHPVLEVREEGVLGPTWEVGFPVAMDGGVKMWRVEIERR